MTQCPTFGSRAQFNSGNSRMSQWVETSFPLEDSSGVLSAPFPGSLNEGSFLRFPFQELRSFKVFFFFVSQPFTCSFFLLEPQLTQQVRICIFLSYVHSGASLSICFFFTVCWARGRTILQVSREAQNSQKACGKLEIHPVSDWLSRDCQSHPNNDDRSRGGREESGPGVKVTGDGSGVIRAAR